MNPLKSRSTIICFACLAALIVIDGMAMYAGYFNVEFASLSIFVLREMVDKVFGHQQKTDSAKNGEPNPTPAPKVTLPPIPQKL